ncbi:MAG TPA: GlsB/YeaQ/YmgE family stress response membrane protein [Herpetosiphonaceae bacterium]|nr:GlsB/YeaQ/YmgE family stress response membrane protein [Herpetosiphonaceae bacterium]
MGIIVWLIFGGLVGWIASMIMGTNAQQGLLMNIIVGIIGAFLGGFVAQLLGFGTEGFQFFDIGSWITAILGAVILLFLVKQFTGRRV